jgi:hypothetical protein
MTDEYATRFEDLFEILNLALLKTRHDFGDYELIPSALPMTESRLLQEVKTGRLIDLIWSSTSPQKEQALRPIRIPLRKGILGYRIGLIHKSSQLSFNDVESLDDLRQFRIAQGIGWGDVELYKHNGIIVGQAPYQSLFTLIEPKRFQLFPRGVSEIFHELEVYGTANSTLAIEENIVLYYPWPYYFFTSKTNETLANRIEVGIERMIDDGSFEAIFLKYNRAPIEKAKLNERRLIPLTNPFLPDKTPLDRAELWFVPEDKPLSSPL